MFSDYIGAHVVALIMHYGKQRKHQNQSGVDCFLRNVVLVSVFGFKGGRP